MESRLNHLRLRRRQILLGGVAAGVAATTGSTYFRQTEAQRRQAQLLALAEQYQQDPATILEAAIAADARQIEATRELLASVQLTPPTLPYDRAISKRLIHLSHLATIQYLTGKASFKYDGALQSLPAGPQILKGYKQIAAFRGEEREVRQTVPVLVPTQPNRPTDDLVEQQFNVAEDALRDTVKEMIQVQRRVPVFYGAVLTSKTGNILMFRGTQQNAEWIRNFLAVQEPYRDAATGKTYGQVHSGFLDIYSNLILEPRPHKMAEQLDPTVPCYIAGHSLGGALAILAAIDIALKVPKLRPNLRLYTYGCPRVGDKIFAEAHSQLIPNSYRVANQADTMTLVPPTNQMGGVFIHIGEEWAFLSQNQDVMPNHIVDTYRVAIDREQETRSIKSWHQIHKG